MMMIRLVLLLNGSLIDMINRHDDIIARRLEVKPDGQDSAEEPATAVKAGT